MIRKTTMLVGILLLLVPPLFGGEQAIDLLRQKYLPPDVIPLTVTQVVNLGYPSIDSGKMFSKGSIYTTTLEMNYRDAKVSLEDKGVIFVEIDREDTKMRSQEFQKVKKTKIEKERYNPWMIPDYQVSMGESEEEWQFILSTHRFDTVTAQWVKKTTLRIIIPSGPAVQEQVTPSPSQAPPKAQTPKPSLQPTKKPTPAPAPSAQPAPQQPITPPPPPIAPSSAPTQKRPPVEQPTKGSTVTPSLSSPPQTKTKSQETP